MNETNQIPAPTPWLEDGGNWVAWDHTQTRIVASGPTRAQAATAAREAGEAEPVLENRTRTRDLLAAARLRGQAVGEELLAAEGGLLTAGAVSALLSVALGEVEKRRAAGSLLAVPAVAGGYAYPAWQFSAGHTLPGLAQVLADLRGHDAWTQLVFFLRGHLRLGGATPLEELRQGQVEKVRRVARTYGEHGAA
jgi:hypothetical protein